MHDLPLLLNLAVVLAYALVGGLLARRVGLPTIVGYLVAGVALGPFTPGFHADETSVRQFAEFGVILLMFGVGLHFSFDDLWRVRRLAIPGALIQMATVTAVGFAVARWWGVPTGGSVVFGIALSITSTVVLTRALMDRAWLETPHGKVAMGWLVFEDLLTVAILVLLPVAAGPGTGDGWRTAGIAVGKAVLFLFLMMYVGDRLVPAALSRIVHTRSRELSVLVALTVAVGTALASAKFFDVSLALGAFVAGVVVGESPFSHQVGADLLPFREAFAVMFFVSIGMLVKPEDVIAHWDLILITIFVIVVVKGLVSGLLAVLLRCSGRTALVLAAGRGQVGEFSFILGQSAVAFGLLTDQQYSLILAGAIGSITINPLVIKLVDPAERFLKRRPALWRLIDRPRVAEASAPPTANDHVVIVGCGRVGRHIAEALAKLNIPRIVIEGDPERVDKLRELGVPVIYGDASSSEILDHVGLERARALVVTLPDDAAALAVVTTAHLRAPKLDVIARAATWDGARRLVAAGATHVVRPELEGGVEIVRRTLLDLNLPVREVQRYTELIRQEGIGETERQSADQMRMLEDLVNASRQLEVGWVEIVTGSPLVGHTLADSRLRERAGVTVVAISRNGDVVTNPVAQETIRAGDRLAVIGTPGQVGAAETMLRLPPV